MRELHLFAGAGGGILGGMLLGHTPVCAVEVEPYCRDVLRARQADGLLPSFPIFNDVREFDGRLWRGRVDVVCGGFPCQPWSAAGKRKGADDERHLWPEMARIVEEVRPTYVFAENVSLAAFGEPWRDLRRLGYRVPPALCLSAADVGAPHLRKRWWLLAADADSDEHKGGASAQRGAPAAELPADAHDQHAESVDAEVADASRARLEVGQGPEGQRAYAAATRAGWWATEPDVGGGTDGLAPGLDGGWIGEALRELRQGVGAASIERATRGLGLLQAEAVLLAFVREHAAGGRLPRELVEGEATPRSILRAMRDNRQPDGTPLRREQVEQRVREHPDAMRALSQLVASRGTTYWSNPLWESGVDRVATGVLHRVDRLRAIGNGQVPQCAAEAFRILMAQAGDEQ